MRTLRVSGLVAGALLATLLCLTGCGKKSQVTVRGKITLGGEPLDAATVSFVPLWEGQSQAGWATTIAGAYEIPATAGLTAGSFRVEIRALRAVAGKTQQPDPTLPIDAKEAVPATYNTQSQLKVDLSPGVNEQNFDLKLK